MNTYLSIFVIGLACSLVGTPLVRRIAERRGWFDLPLDKRRVHSRPIPRIGGVAIYFSVVVTLASLLLVNNLLTESLRAGRARLLAVLAAATFVFLFGLYDDFRGSRAALKVAALTIGATMLYFSGVSITAISIPFVG